MKQFKDILNVLSFASFRPEAEDPSATWSQRFPNKKTLLLNVNRNTVSWQIMLKGGELGDSAVEQGSLQDVVQVMGEEWKSLTDDGWCSVSLNNRFILSLETNLSRKKGYQDLLRTNPKSVLGSKFERGKCYAVRHHAETNSSLLLACEDGLIKETQDTLKKAGLNTGRLSCGVFAVVCEVLERLQISARESSEDDEASAIPQNYLLIACCEGSVCVLKQKDNQWTELRSRSAYYEPGDLSSLGQILQPMLSDWDAQSPVLFVNDRKDETSFDQLKAMLPNYSINDVSMGEQLWTVIGKN